MKIRQMFSLFLLFFSFTSVGYAEFSNLSKVSDFKGGLDEVAINRCNAAMESTCSIKDGLESYLQCAEKAFGGDKQCKQNLALLKNERGFFDIINLYGNVAVVKAKVYAADHSDNYFMVDKKGEFVRLTAEVDLKKSPMYQKVSKQFKAVELWPTATTLPTVEILKEGKTRVIFPQLLLNGCHACEQAGIARIAYLFLADGTYLGAELVDIIPTTVQQQA